MSLRKILLASVLMTATALPSFATEYGTWNDNSLQQGAIGSLVVNDQVNTVTNWSNLSGVVDTVGGDVVAMGAAAGNIVDVITMDNTRAFNNQIVSNSATIGSNVALDANNVWGSVGVNNSSLCNGASVSTDPFLTSVKSYQECNARDTYTGTSAFVTNIGGNAVFQGSAISNSFEADSNAPNFLVFNKQINGSSAISNMAVNAFNVGGTIGMQSSAIGNTARVIHYNTGGH
jgi:hypothetical protein